MIQIDISQLQNGFMVQVMDEADEEYEGSVKVFEGGQKALAKCFMEIATQVFPGEMELSVKIKADYQADEKEDEF